MCFTICHGKRLGETLKLPRLESRELQGLGQHLGSCNVSSRSHLRQNFKRLGLGSEGLMHMPGF